MFTETYEAEGGKYLLEIDFKVIGEYRKSYAGYSRFAEPDEYPEIDVCRMKVIQALNDDGEEIKLLPEQEAYIVAKYYDTVSEWLTDKIDEYTN